MEQYFLIWFLILFIGTIVGYFIVKNVLKTVVTFLFIVFLFATITIILTYSDIQEIRQEFGEKEVVVILHEDQQLIFSAVVKNLWSEKNKTEYEEITIEEEELENLVEKKKYKRIIEETNADQLIAVNISVYNISEEYSFDQRAAAGELLNNALFENKIYFLQQYKQGSIEIYPQTVLLSVLKTIPISWIEKVLPSND